MPVHRIAVNGKALGRAQPDGSARVAISLVREMAVQRPDLGIDLLVPAAVQSGGAHVETDYGALARGWPSNVRVRRFPSHWFGNGIGRSTWEQFHLPGLVHRYGPYDVLVNFTNSAPVVRSLGIPQVLFLHDVGFLNTEWFTRRFSWYMRGIVRLAAHRDVRVVTVSETSASQIRRLLPGFDSVTVVPNDSDDPPAGVRPYQADGPYVLFLGSINRRKNLSGAIEGFSRFCRNDERETPPHLFVAGGRRQIFAQERSDARTEPHVTRLGYVDDRMRWSLLAGARVLLLPSFLEGFGLPILEAMKVGTPVVASEIPVFRELFDGAIEYIDPADPATIAAGISRLWKDEARRAELICRGHEVAARYSWRASARKYLDLLDRIAEERVR